MAPSSGGGQPSKSIASTSSSTHYYYRKSLPHTNIHHKRLVLMWIKRVKNMVCVEKESYLTTPGRPLGGCPFAAWHIAKLVRQGRCPRVRSPGRQLPLSMLHS